MWIRATATLIATMVSAVCLAQNCKDFVVLDRHSSSTDYLTYEQTKHAICSSEATDRGSAQNAAVKAGIPIPVAGDLLDLSFSGNSSSSNYDKWKLDFCKSDFNEVYTNLKQRNLSEIFSSNAKEVVAACLNSEPVYAYYDVAPDGQSFKFHFQVQGTERLESSKIEPAAAVSDCKPDSPFSLPKKKVISGQKNEFSCTWTPTKGVHTTLILLNQGTRSYDLPAIPPAPTPPAPPTAPPHPEMMVEERTYSSEPQWSGQFKNFSGWYNHCTPTLPEKTVIVTPPRISLTGDRTCGGYSECKIIESTATRVCMQFRLQGHEEDLGKYMRSGPNGMLVPGPIPEHGGERQSSAVITVVLQHPK